MLGTLFTQLTTAQSSTSITLLTPNLRLRALLSSEYATWQAQQGESVWKTPFILPLNTWLEQQWQSINHHQQFLLSSAQEMQLWESIINQAPQQDALLSTHASATLVKQAWQNLQLWSLELDVLCNSHHQEALLFYQWGKHFEAITHQEKWISAAQLPKAFLDAIEHGRIQIQSHIWLFGFDELAPVMKKLFQTLANYTQVKMIPSPIHHATIHRIHPDDIESEILTMARWSKTLLDQNPNHKVGCIVPELNQYRSLIQRAFTEVFSIENVLPGTHTPTKYFNISAGLRLVDYPILKSALLVLQMTLGSIEVETFSPLLQSTYLCEHPQDSYVGAQIDSALRELNEPNLMPSSILAIMTNFHAKFPNSTWLKRWKNFTKQNRTAKPFEAPIFWRNYFLQNLMALGWPGSRTLNSLEYQLVARFKALLEESCQLAIVTPKFTQSQALQNLHRLLHETQFQPEGSEAPVQILGLLESAGYEFDALWIMGLHDEIWPPPAKPNPFIPISIQTKYAMPHASALREMQYTQQLMQRLETASPIIIMSCAKQLGDKPSRVSQLIAHHAEISLEALQLPAFHSYAHTIFRQRQLQTLTDDQAPTLYKHEPVHGGSAIFKYQALCPFRAFATIRLNTTSPAHPELGILATEKGSLMHKALDFIWAEIKTHDQLCQMSEQALTTLVQQCIHKTIHPLLHQTHSQAKTIFLELESVRLLKLLLQWLDMEKKRSHFTVIERESRRTAQIGDLKLHLTIDRIDQLSDGSKLIIDYKSGISQINQWQPDNLTDPQLPIYAVFTDKTQPFTPYDGISFAQVRSGQLQFKGVVSHPDRAFSNVVDVKKFTTPQPMNWQTLLLEWQSRLEQLSKDFCDGKAVVEPANEQACHYCHLQPLCRVTHT